MSPVSAFLPGEEEQQLEHYRHMPASEKFKEIGILNRLRTERQRADIRARYGNIPEDEMRMRLGVKRLGREMMVKVFGWDPDEGGEIPSARQRGIPNQVTCDE